MQQEAELGLHACPVERHAAGGVSQKQPVLPFVHETTDPLEPYIRHERPLQQLASLVQDCEAFEQEGGGGPHTPELQTSVAEQHGKLELHEPPLFAQVGGGAEVWQVPLTQVSGEQHSPLVVQLVPVALQQVPAVAPAAIVQVVGEQQSAFAVQLAPPGWQAPPPPEVAVLQTWVAESQRAEQQSALVLQAAPSPTQPPHTLPSKQ